MYGGKKVKNLLKMTISLIFVSVLFVFVGCGPIEGTDEEAIEIRDAGGEVYDDQIALTMTLINSSGYDLEKLVFKISLDTSDGSTIPVNDYTLTPQKLFNKNATLEIDEFQPIYITPSSYDVSIGNVSSVIIDEIECYEFAGDIDPVVTSVYTTGSGTIPISR